MSTAIFEAKANGMATKNDALRNAFAITGIRCILLKRGEHTGVFTEIVELASGYRVKFDDNRAESGLLRFATTDLNFRDQWSLATHVAYGVPEGEGIEIFSFIAEEKDTIDPDGSSVYWSGRIAKMQNERYTI